MKKLLATLLLVSSTFALSACGTGTASDSYAYPRTANYGASEQAVTPAEEVFQKAQKK